MPGRGAPGALEREGALHQFYSENEEKKKAGMRKGKIFLTPEEIRSLSSETPHKKRLLHALRGLCVIREKKKRGEKEGEMYTFSAAPEESLDPMVKKGRRGEGGPCTLCPRGREKGGGKGKGRFSSSE